MPMPSPDTGKFPKNPFYDPEWSGTGCGDSASCMPCFANPSRCDPNTYSTCTFERAWCQSGFGLMGGEAVSWINVFTWVIFLTALVIYAMQPARALVPIGPLRSWGLLVKALQILTTLVVLAVATLALFIATAYSVPMYLLPNHAWSSTMEDSPARGLKYTWGLV